MTPAERYKIRNEQLAVSDAIRSGVPASITLAQGILESEAGNSRLAREGNNHFGIKCHGWSGQSIYANDDQPNECFRKYPTVLHSYADHSNFLKKNDRYKNLFRLSFTDYEGWARGLQAAGYATANNYAETLIRIIRDNRLYEADTKAQVRKIMQYVEYALILIAISLLIYLAIKYRKNKA